MFGKISEINPNIPNTYVGKIFLTIDVDWAPDFIIEELIDLFQFYQVKSTWLITHKSPALDKIYHDELFEIGIHPNFNKLLDGEKDEPSPANAKNIILNLLDIAPEAKVVRCHSLLQSSRILDLLSEFGLTHDLNHLLPYNYQPSIRPWKLNNGLIRVPFWWEDDFEFNRSKKFNLGSELRASTKNYGLNVLNFHPIHIFLNTDTQKRYEDSKKYNSRIKLTELINVDFGTRTRFLEVLNLGSKS